MDVRPLSPNHLLLQNSNKFRVWGAEGDEPDVKITVDAADKGEGGDELSDEEKAAKETQDKLDKATQKQKDAEKRASDAEKALQDKEREGMEDAQRTEAERDDYKTKYEALLKVVETTTLDSCIASISSKKQKDGTPKYDWHDPQALRSMLNMEDLNLDLDNATFDGLDTQLADIAKKHPWMLVSKETRDEGGYQPPDQRGTGNHPRGGTARQPTTDRKELAKKFKFDHLVVGGSPR